ncbi:MAG TPA: ABC transporter ATP-binding protein [Longimicrobiales bacterium]|nr:ABC transporter ATP-binding protein [Longimicrobiales bacterium]
MIGLRDLTVSFEGFTLGPLTLDVGPGERVALVGPNGAGTSTTRRSLAGRHTGYAGSARVLGLEVREEPAAARARVGVLPEDALGFGWMTVAEHLRFLSAFFPTWDREYATRLAARTGLPVGTRLANPSKGSRVKLSLVAAEAFRPEVLLLDEPTSGIDPVTRADILALIDECAPRGGGRTVLFSTHILEDVEAVADRVVLLKDGRVLRDAPVHSLRQESPGMPLSTVLLRELTGG